MCNKAAAFALVGIEEGALSFVKVGDTWIQELHYFGADVTCPSWYQMTLSGDTIF